MLDTNIRLITAISPIPRWLTDWQTQFYAIGPVVFVDKETFTCQQFAINHTLTLLRRMTSPIASTDDTIRIFSLEDALWQSIYLTDRNQPPTTTAQMETIT